MKTVPIELVAPVVLTLLTCIGVLWREMKKWQRKWEVEMRRNVILAFSPKQETVPPPDFQEDTIARTIRAKVTAEETVKQKKHLAEHLRMLDQHWNPNESTPP